MTVPCACPICGNEIKGLPLTLLPERGMVLSGDQFVMLPGMEMALLQRLAEVFPRSLAKDTALEWLYHTYHEDETPVPKILDVYICRIRRAIKPLGIVIDTQWGKGFSLRAPAKPIVIEALSDHP